LSPDEINFMVNRHTTEWADFLKKKPVENQRRSIHWVPPQEEWTKINLDGAFHADSGRGGCGCLARDHEGKPVFAGDGVITNAGEAIATEAKALLQAISIAQQMGIGRPIFATDCQVLKHVVTLVAYDAAPLGGSVLITCQLRLSLIESTIMYENRECNKRAHVLAALGAAQPLGYHRLWLHNYPSDITDAMYGNLAVAS
jgi:ribonuclease HI